MFAVPMDTAEAMISTETGNPPGMVPEGDFPITYRVCAECVTKADPKLPAPVLTLLGGEVPLVRQSRRPE